MAISIVIVVAAMTIIPALNISGMKGLAIFYILLFAIAPIFWFAIHWIVGKFMRPPLSFGEAALIVGAPIALVSCLLCWHIDYNRLLG